MSPARPVPPDAWPQPPIVTDNMILSEVTRMAADLLDARKRIEELEATPASTKTHTITLTKRADDWHACLDGDRSRWSAGKTREAAVCGLIATWGEAMDLVVVEAA